jgi:hypothetical protein
MILFLPKEAFAEIELDFEEDVEFLKLKAKLKIIKLRNQKDELKSTLDECRCFR